jgi:CBS domain-containing protein
MKITDLMARDVVTVAPDAPLKEVARLLVEHRISGVPVVDAQGHVLGVVSEADILAKTRGEGPERSLVFAALHPAELLEEASKLAARRAQEAMTAPALTVTEHVDVATASALMLDRDIARLPVVDAEGRLAGIVTRADVVRAFLRGDDEIAEEIQELLLETLWIAPEAVDVDVRAGVVSLSGELETWSSADLLARLVRRVPGVVDVHSRVRWLSDRHAEQQATLPHSATLS